MDAKPTPASSPSMLKLVLWTILWLVMCFWAIIGPLFVLLGALSFFVDLSGSMSLFNGEPVRTPQQKTEFLLVGLGLAVVGIGFLWLVRRGHVKEPV